MSRIGGIRRLSLGYEFSSACWGRWGWNPEKEAKTMPSFLSLCHRLCEIKQRLEGIWVGTRRPRDRVQEPRSR